MDSSSWTGRKRPWQEDDPIETQLKRRASTSSTGERHAPPPPQPAGSYARDTGTLGQRRLPPLYTPTCSASAELPTASSLQPSSPSLEASGLGSSRRGSHSLLDILQPPQTTQYESGSGSVAAVALPDIHDPINLNRSLPPISTGTHQPSRLGSNQAPHAAGAVTCCPTDCSGPACSHARSVLRKLATELLFLDNRVRSILQKESNPTYEQPNLERISTSETLQWALDMVQWTNLKLSGHTDTSPSHTPDQSLGSTDATSTMRRGQHPTDRDDQLPAPRQFGAHAHEFTRFQQPLGLADDSRRNTYGSDTTPIANSPHHTASSSGSAFVPSQSPMQAPQSLRPGLLPSPSSMNFPNVSNLPPISPPASSMQVSPQAAHLQDLQHQISVKTLAFQTLQREYDSLIQKLERQRTKCATLEKKFEVSDVEINSLTDEKEKLQAQVASLESQVEELQQSREEARRQLSANSSQYMRIMEMANRLQAQGAEDKKRWESEKAELEQRIKVLEEAMVTGTDRPSTSLSLSSANVPAGASSALQVSSASSAETVNVLRAEIGRLRSRTQTLESALLTMREESISIQNAARQLIESGGKIEKAAENIAIG